VNDSESLDFNTLADEVMGNIGVFGLLVVAI
jgi:hypothetical protein